MHDIFADDDGNAEEHDGPADVLSARVFAVGAGRSKTQPPPKSAAKAQALGSQAKGGDVLAAARRRVLPPRAAAPATASRPSPAPAEDTVVASNGPIDDTPVAAEPAPPVASAPPATAPPAAPRPELPALMPPASYLPSPPPSTEAASSTTIVPSFRSSPSAPTEEARALPPHIVDLTQSLAVAATCARSSYRLSVQLSRAEVGQFNGFATTVADIDDGAMVTLVSKRFWELHKASLGPLLPTPRKARMADQRTVAFEGELPLTITVEGVPTKVDAFVLQGEWDVLLSKPWLHESRVVHFYALDWCYMFPPDVAYPPVVFLPNAARPPAAALDPIAAIQALMSRRAVATPSYPLQPGPLADEDVRWIKAVASQWSDVGEIDEYARVMDMPPEVGIASDVDTEAVPVRTVSVAAVVDVPDLPPERKARRELWKPYHIFGSPQASPARAQKIVDLIKFGDQLSVEQKGQLISLVQRYQHVFGLSAREVASNKHVRFDIKLKAGAHCPQRAPRDPGLSPLEREWLVDYCRKLLDAGILRPVPAAEVKWISDIKIVPKGKGSYASTDKEVLLDMANHGLREALLPHDPTRAAPPPLGEADWIPTKGLRLVHNYIPLNRMTEDVTRFPVGAMDQKVASLAGRSFYSNFDMLMGYFAIEATEAAQDLLTFFVEGMGYLTYTRMPFGPVESPARFNDFGSQAFGSLDTQLHPHTAFVRWMDDLNLASSDFQSHLEAVEKLFQLCEDCGVSLSPSKTELAAEGVKWCGNVVGKTGITSDPAKVAAIVRWPEPRTPMDVLRFINTASFLRSRIPDFSALAGPLLRLAAMAEVPDGVGRRRGVRRKALNIVPLAWSWQVDERQSFALMKAAVAFAIASTPADFSKPWYVDSDASPDAFGGALLQEDPDDPRKRRIIAVASKRCSNAERNQSQFLRELMAIRFALDRFQPFIRGCRIILTTDCQGLVDLLNATDISSTYIRWRESLLSFNIVKVAHRPGARNLVCDGLSRPPPAEVDEPEAVPVRETWEERHFDGAGASWAEPVDLGIATLAPDNVDTPAGRAAAKILQRHRLQSYDTSPHPSLLDHDAAVRLVVQDDDAESLLATFADDPLLPIVEFLVTAKLPTNFQKAAVVKRMSRTFFRRGAELFHVTQAREEVLKCVTEVVGRELASESHAREGHYGRDLVILRLRQDGIYFAAMQRNVRDVVMACVTCQSWGAQQRAALLGPIIHPQPLDLIALDFVAFPATDEGVKYALVAGDYFSHFLWAEPTPDTGKGVAAFLRRFVTIAAVPRRIVTDNGSHFANKEVKEVCEALGIEQSFVPVHAPWVNGLVERGNGLLIQQLRTLCKDAGTRDWAALLPIAVQNVNRRVMPAVGYAPQQLLFGIIHFGAFDSSELQPPVDANPPHDEIVEVHQTLVEVLRDGVTAARIAQITTEDTQPLHDFEVGDLVMLKAYKPSDKLAPRWEGPYRVSATLPASATLETLDGLPIKRRHHINNLKRFEAAFIEEEEVT